MSDSTVRYRRAAAFAAGLCFFLSGAAGLVYEIVWMRMLGLLFGHTVLAITTVLVAFMAGLALGAWLLGSRIDHWSRPLAVYGLLEIGIGVYAVLVPAFLSWAEAGYLAVHRALAPSALVYSFVQFALASMILVLPTTLMGASLPVMTKFFAERLHGLGRTVGNLYALNTFGAVAGSAAAGFVLLPVIGIQATTALAATVNVAVGVTALLAARRTLSVPAAGAPETGDRAAREAQAPLMAWLLVAGIGLSGVSSMIYEITWTRALSLVIGSSVYAFGAMLTTFLVGLALGSFLFGWVQGRRTPSAGLFGWLEIAAGLAALALVPVFERMPDLVLILLQRMSPSASTALLTQFGMSFLAMIIPATIIGATLPCVVQVCVRALPRLGRDVGRVYSANTLGTIAGALLAGFLLVPALGIQLSMIGAAALNVAVGAAVLAASGAGRPAWRRAGVVSAVALFAAGVAFLPRWDRQVMAAGVSVYGQKFVVDTDPVLRFRQDAAARQLLFYREGVNSTVSVERTAQTTSLKVDGKVDASNGLDMLTQLMLGHLPVFLHPRPERVLVIGLGSGVTVGAVAQHAIVREIDVVEIEPAVVEASRFFVRENRNALRDPRVRLLIGDGRNVVLASAKQYDVISSEPSNPWMAGVANLFSRDFYHLARGRLAPGGIMVQWLHGYSLFPRELRMIVATFRRVFPHVTLWRTISGDYLLVGTESPLTVDFALLEQRHAASAAAREDLVSIGLDSPEDFLTLFLVDEAGLARFAEGAPENSDDRPLLEFAAPLALYAATVEENSRLLRQARTREFPLTLNLPPGRLEARRLRFARAYWARGEKEEALDQLTKARADDFASRLERAKLRFSLGDLRGATAEFEHLTEGRPGDRLLRSYLRAGAFLRQFGAEEVVSHHARTRFGNPNPAEAHNNLGVFYTQVGVRTAEPAFFDLAVDVLEAARQIEPQAYPVVNNLGNAYFELGRLAEAAQAYRQVIALAPGEAQPRFNLGLVYETQGSLELAVGEFEAASVLEPAWPLPRLRLAQLRRGAQERR